MGGAIAERMMPFFSIWVVPRTTIRRIVDTEPDSLVVIIAWSLGALAARACQVQVNANPLPVEELGWLKSLGPASMAMTVFSSGVAAIGLVYFFGFAYIWAGRVLGGIADVGDVRSAIAWGWVPLIILSLVAMAAALSAPAANAWVEAPKTIFDRITLWNVVEVAIAVWSAVVSVQTLAEVHRFSALRAIGTKLIGALVLTFCGVSLFIVITIISLIASLI
jgi:hypothetical protein